MVHLPAGKSLEVLEDDAVLFGDAEDVEALPPQEDGGDHTEVKVRCIC